MLVRIARAFILVQILAWINLAQAAVWDNHYSIAVLAQHEDNYYLSQQNELAASALALNPEFGFTRSSDALNLDIYASSEHTRYSEQEIRDTDRYYLDLKGEYQGLRNRILLDGYWRRDTTLAVVRAPAAIEDETDAIVDVTDEALVDTVIERDKVQIRPRWRHELSERSEFELGYRYSTLLHDDNGLTTLTDYRQHRAEITYRYKFSERGNYFAALNNDLYKAEGRDERQSWAVRAGSRYRLSERTAVNGNLGIVAVETAGKESSQYNLGLGLASKGQTDNFNIAVRRSADISGFGDLVENNQLVFASLHKFSPLLEGRLRASLLRTTTIDAATNASDRDYYKFESRLSWLIGRQWATDLGYLYQKRIREAADTEADSNMIYLAIRYFSLEQ